MTGALYNKMCSRSRCGVVDKPLASKPEVAGLIPGFTGLSDETLSHGPILYMTLAKHKHNNKMCSCFSIFFHQLSYIVLPQTFIYISKKYVFLFFEIHRLRLQSVNLV